MVEARAEIGVPAYVVSPPHLIFEKSRQQQALRAGRLHHFAILQKGGVRHEVIEDLAQIRGGGPTVCDCVDTSA